MGVVQNVRRASGNAARWIVGVRHLNDGVPRSCSHGQSGLKVRCSKMSARCLLHWCVPLIAVPKLVPWFEGTKTSGSIQGQPGTGPTVVLCHPTPMKRHIVNLFVPRCAYLLINASCGKKINRSAGFVGRRFLSLLRLGPRIQARQGLSKTGMSGKR